MANPIERNIVKASELLRNDFKTGAQMGTRVTEKRLYIEVDHETAEAILSAHHTASSLDGLLRSTKRSRGKTALMRKLAGSLLRDMEQLSAVVFAAYERKAG